MSQSVATFSILRFRSHFPAVTDQPRHSYTRILSVPQISIFLFSQFPQATLGQHTGGTFIEIYRKNCYQLPHVVIRSTTILLSLSTLSIQSSSCLLLLTVSVLIISSLSLSNISQSSYNGPVSPAVRPYHWLQLVRKEVNNTRIMCPGCPQSPPPRPSLKVLTSFYRV